MQDRSVAVDREAQLSDCIYFQWDTLEQRMHAIQKRAAKTDSTNDGEPLVYTMFTINAKGQFDSIVRSIERD